MGTAFAQVRVATALNNPEQGLVVSLVCFHAAFKPCMGATARFLYIVLCGWIRGHWSNAIATSAPSAI